MIDSATPLRDTAASSVEVPPAIETPPQPLRLPVGFTGTGGEYFRIWVVNLLLTVVTLGIYSAWAKVRKTRYFWTNTRLDGAAFQYHGNPVAILRGRILVGLLFAAYSLAGRISLRAGAAAALALGLVAPWLFLKAMRFKLTNTSWRGIRFGFDSTVGAAYGALGGAVVLWVLMSAAIAAMPGEKPNPVPLLVTYALIFALTPLLHARIKRYQHGATTCGSVRFQMDPSVGAFYGVYARTLLLALPVVIMFAAGMGIAFWSVQGSPASAPERFYVAVGIAYLVSALAYVVVVAFFTARLDRVVWSRTRGGPIRFATSISTGPLLRVWVRNGVLTLLTLGLYWPFAAVNIARYRIACMSVEADAPLGTIAAGALGVEPSAAGDGAVDFFGWDVGL